MTASGSAPADTAGALYCALCMWVREDSADVARAVTIINGQAVCLEHREAASLGRDHRHAAVIAGARL